MFSILSPFWQLPYRIQNEPDLASKHIKKYTAYWCLMMLGVLVKSLFEVMGLSLDERLEKVDLKILRKLYPGKSLSGKIVTYAAKHGVGDFSEFWVLNKNEPKPPVKEHFIKVLKELPAELSIGGWRSADCVALQVLAMCMYPGEDYTGAGFDSLLSQLRELNVRVASGSTSNRRNLTWTTFA